MRVEGDHESRVISTIVVVVSGSTVLVRTLTASHRTFRDLIKTHGSHLGGVVISVLVAAPKGCGFEPGKDDGF
jgi:hypothetical protein